MSRFLVPPLDFGGTEFFSDNFDNLNGWTTLTGSPSVSSNILYPNGAAKLVYNKPLTDLERQWVDFRLTEQQDDNHNINLYIGCDATLANGYVAIFKRYNSNNYRIFRIVDGATTQLYIGGKCIDNDSHLGYSSANFELQRPHVDLEKDGSDYRITCGMGPYPYYGVKDTSPPTVGGYVGVAFTNDSGALERFRAGVSIAPDLSQFDEIGDYTYSSLANIPTGNVAVYNGFAYVTYTRAPDTDGGYEVWILKVNLSTGVVAQSQKIYDHPVGTLDFHFSATVDVDSNGYIHIAYGNRLNVSIKYARSTNTEDITAWETEVDWVWTGTAGTRYHNLFCIDKSGTERFVCLNAGSNTSGDRCLWDWFATYSTTMDGAPDVGDLETNEIVFTEKTNTDVKWIYIHDIALDKTNEEVHIVATVVANSTVASNRVGVFYFKTTDCFATLQNAADETLTGNRARPDWYESDKICFNTPVYPMAVELKSDGNPVILWSKATTDYIVQSGKYHIFQCNLMVSVYAGSAWTTYQVHTRDLWGAWNAHLFLISDTNWRIVTRAEDHREGLPDASGKKTLYMYETTDAGVSWTESVVVPAYYDRTMNTGSAYIHADRKGDDYAVLPIRGRVLGFKPSELTGTGATACTTAVWTGDTVIDDDFVNDDGTALSTHNALWETEGDGLWTIQSNKMICSTPSGVSFATVNTGQGDHEIIWKWTPVAGDLFTGVYRFINDENYYIIYGNEAGNYFRHGRYVGGSLNYEDDAYTITPGVQLTIRVIAVRQIQLLEVNGVITHEWGYVSHVYTGLKAGMRSYNATQDVSFDECRINKL